METFTNIFSQWISTFDISKIKKNTKYLYILHNKFNFSFIKQLLKNLAIHQIPTKSRGGKQISIIKSVKFQDCFKQNKVIRVIIKKLKIFAYFKNKDFIKSTLYSQ